MTNTVANTEMNVYAASMFERVKREKLNASNQKRAEKTAFAFTSAKIAAFFKKAKVDETLFNREVSKDNFFCLYSTFFMRSIAEYVTDEKTTLKDLEENVIVTLKTAFALHTASLTLTEYDIECALDKSLDITDDAKKSVIVRRSDAYSSAKRQKTMCMNALRELNIVTSINRHEYKVNDNATTTAIKKKMFA